MFVRVEVLETRGSLVGLGSHPNDRIVLRGGLPLSPGSTKPDTAPQEAIHAPIVNQRMGLTLSADVTNGIKHELTKSAEHRELDQYRLRLTITKDGKWFGSIYVRLVCLAHGFMVERWVSLMPARGVGPGKLKLRIALGHDEDTVMKVWKGGDAVGVHDASRTKGCQCDLCDPNHELRDKAGDIRRAVRDARVLTILCCSIS